MEICRTCLTETVEKDVSELSVELKGDKKSYWDIMLFCLNIQILPKSKLTTKLCDKCFIKIISFHEFKTLALKSDAYLHCLQNQEDNKCDSFDIENIKCEVMSNEHSDDIFSDIGALGKDDYEIKNEQDIADVPSDEELLSVIKKIKYKYVTEEYKGNSKKKSCPRKKVRCKKVRIRKENKVPEQREKICEECGKTVVNLIDHMKLHLPVSERKRIKCKGCDKTFASYSARYRHNKTKHLAIKQHCSECGKQFVNLRSHRLLVHSKDDLPYECLLCEQRFISKSNLDIHTLKHTKVRPHACDMCDKDFRLSIGLLKHKRQVHDKEKSHMCQICSKRFFAKHHLQEHLRSHTKERPFECPECGKFFSSKTIMKSHLMIHSNVKKFSCDLCDMAFKKQTYLRAHMISHTKEKRYLCSYCDMPFGRSDHRARHERTAHQRSIKNSKIDATTTPNQQ